MYVHWNVRDTTGMPEGRVLWQLESHRIFMNANMLEELSKDKLGRLAASIFCWIHQETSTQFSVSIAFGHAKKETIHVALAVRSWDFA